MRLYRFDFSFQGYPPLGGMWGAGTPAGRVLTSKRYARRLRVCRRGAFRPAKAGRIHAVERLKAMFFWLPKEKI